MTGSTLETSKEPLFERFYKIARALRPLPTQEAAPNGEAPQLSVGQELLSRLQQANVQPLVAKVRESYLSGQEQALPLLNHMGDYLTELDDRWQLFVHTRIDPLLGGERSQQFNELGIQMSAAEKEINRRLLFSVGNMGIAWVATYFFPPLSLINAAMMVWLGLPIYRRGWQTLVEERRLTYPVVLAGAAATILLGGQYVPGSVMMFAIIATNKLVNRTEDHFRRSIVDALGQQPRTVWRLRGDVAVETPLAEIARGDLLVVGAGEMIAVDGVIVEGAAVVDQHRLTGEAQPAEKAAGDEVLASTVVLSGKIQLYVHKTGQETSAAQIATILQRVSRNRINFSSRLDKFADSMTAPMLALGGTALLTLGPMSAAAIMSVGVGSLARIGGPLATLNYLNVAARHGLLVKDARSFELLKKVNTFVFDKTGTLTLEQPQVYMLHLCLPECQPGSEAWAEAENLLLRFAAAAEARQSHPVAKAILAAARERKLEIPAIEEAHLELGYGIKVRLTAAEGAAWLNPQSPLAALLQPEADLQILVGSWRFLEMEAIPIPAELAAVQERCHAQGHSLVLVALTGQPAGALELQPTVRPEARQAVAELRARGMALYIISGDHDAPTRQLAHSLGIEHFYAGVLPQQKASLVEELKAQGAKICFVGDGINDAIAMGKADVSVSLRGASTLATDTAQIVLMNQNLTLLSFLLQLADEFDRSLLSLFRATLVPVGSVVVSTFLFQTGIYAALLIWQLGVVSGLGMGFWPLWKHRLLMQPAPDASNASSEIVGDVPLESRQISAVSQTPALYRHAPPREPAAADAVYAGMGPAQTRHESGADKDE